MAKLPGIALDPQDGQAPVIAGVEPTDLNLGQAAQATEKVGQAMRVRDDKAVQPYLDQLNEGYARAFSTAAEQDDGTKPGFAQNQMDAYDLHAGLVARDAGLSGGMAEALRRRIAANRIEWGNRAIATEAKNAGQFAADQERAVKNGVVQDAYGRYLAQIGPPDKALDDHYDGSDPTYQAQKDALHDQVAAQVLQTLSPADQPALKLELDNAKLNRRNAAVALQDKLQTQVRVRQASNTIDTLANAVIAHPDSAQSSLDRVDAVLQDIPAAQRAAATDQARSRIVSSRLEGLRLSGQPALAMAELQKGTWDAYLTNEAKQTLVERARTAAHQAAQDGLEAMHYGGSPDPAQVDANAAASGDIGLQAEINYRRAVGWEEQKGLTGDGFSQTAKIVGFQSAANFVVDQLEGGAVTIANDNQHGPSRFGINQGANPDLNVTSLTRPQAIARYRSYWTAVHADQLPPDQALTAFDAAVLFGPEKANAWQAQAQGSVGQFLQLERDEMQRLARADPARYGDDLKGWLNRVDKVQAEAARAAAFVNLRDGFSSDPIKFAAQAPALSSQVPALTGDPGSLEWGQAITGRWNLGRFLNRNYQAPVRTLTEAEAANYKSQIEANPTFAMQLAEAALKAGGPQGGALARQVLSEVGAQGEANVHLHAADLYAMGSTDFARRVEVGLALKGAQLKDPDKKALEAAIERRKGLFVDMPDFRNVVYSTARAAMLADETTGKLQTDPEHYISSALGGTVRGAVSYGGVVPRFDQFLVLPNWLAKDRASDALDTMARDWNTTGRGPVNPNGQPISAETLRQAVPVLLANGKYRLKNKSGVAFVTRDGRPFDFNWDDARAPLRAKLGASAVLAP